MTSSHEENKTKIIDGGKKQAKFFLACSLNFGTLLPLPLI